MDGAIRNSKKMAEKEHLYFESEERILGGYDEKCRLMFLYGRCIAAVNLSCPRHAP